MMRIYYYIISNMYVVDYCMELNKIHRKHITHHSLHQFNEQHQYFTNFLLFSSSFHH